MEGGERDEPAEKQALSEVSRGSSELGARQPTDSGFDSKTHKVDEPKSRADDDVASVASGTTRNLMASMVQSEPTDQTESLLHGKPKDNPFFAGAVGAPAGSNLPSAPLLQYSRGRGSKKLWECWLGRNKFMADGMFVIPASICPASGAVAFLVGIMTIFCSVELQRLEEDGIARQLFFLVLPIYFVALVSYVNAVTKEPGVLPRRDLLPPLTIAPEGRASVERLLEIYADHAREPNTDSPPSRPKDETPSAEDAAASAKFKEDYQGRLDAIPTDLSDYDALETASVLWADIIRDRRIQHMRYCNTCKVRRPMKCSHCRTCNNCVLEFDHHCYWIGNCVGMRNHRAFAAFLVAAVLSCIGLVFIAAMDVLYELHIGFLNGVFKFSDRRVQLLIVTTVICIVLLLAMAWNQRAFPCTRLNRPRVSGQSIRASVVEQRRCSTALYFMFGFTALAWAIVMATLDELPWQGLLVLFTAGPIGSMVSINARDQMMLLGKGLNTKQRKVQRGGLGHPWTFQNLVSFFCFREIGRALAPMRAEIPDVLPSSVMAEKEVEAEDGDDADLDTCGRVGKYLSKLGSKESRPQRNNNALKNRRRREHQGQDYEAVPPSSEGADLESARGQQPGHRLPERGTSGASEDTDSAMSTLGSVDRMGLISGEKVTEAGTAADRRWMQGDGGI
mmetsp:Transcript_26413/g.48318  ORF Transcript_26413/g.48318 Transcript_26413/m.48318 type:complete len:676 (-) Transcript_26413:35-2062(-)